MVRPVPLVPEITLRLASEPVEAWELTGQELGQAGLPPPSWAFARFVLDNPYLPRSRLTAYDVPGLRALEDAGVKRTGIWELGRPGSRG